MKNHRFPWLRNRTTDNRKCEKARNIKEKCTIEMFSTASRQLVEHLSSASANWELLQQSKSIRDYLGWTFLLEKIFSMHYESSSSAIIRRLKESMICQGKIIRQSL